MIDRDSLVLTSYRYTRNFNAMRITTNALFGNTFENRICFVINKKNVLILKKKP